MSILPAEALSEIQLKLLEPDDAGATFPSGLWVRSQILTFLEQRQDRFNRDTHLLLATAIIPTSVGVTRYHDVLPQDWISTQRAVYVDAQDVHTPLTLVDAFSRDHLVVALADRPSTTPLMFDTISPPPASFDLLPAPTTAGGHVYLLYVSTLEPLEPLLPDPMSREPVVTPTPFDVPDDFVPYLIYGTLSDLYSGISRVQNTALAAYYERRYQEGVALAQALLSGWG